MTAPTTSPTPLSLGVEASAAPGADDALSTLVEQPPLLPASAGLSGGAS